MSDKWRGYFVVEQGAIGSGNWAALQVLYESMGSHGTPFPMYNTHWRTSLAGEAVIYESRFDPEEVSIEEFKQLLATEFGVPVEDIDHTQAVVSYSGSIDTMVWEFLYNAVVRFTVRRFGRGGSWNESRIEGLAYIDTYGPLWKPTG
jgi:hypothetical protein